MRLICTCFTCLGGSRGVQVLTNLAGLVTRGVSAKEKPSRAWGEGDGEAGIIMSSNDVGSYEFKRLPREMQMEECSANLARSTADGSADNNKNSNNNNSISHDDVNDNNNDECNEIIIIVINNFNIINNNNINNRNNNKNPPTHRWSSVLGLRNILPFAPMMTHIPALTSAPTQISSEPH